MKITPEILRIEAARIETIIGACIEGAPEYYLLGALRAAANALDEIHGSEQAEASVYHLPSSFQLETEHPPAYVGPLGPLGLHENDPVRLWAEIWKLRSEARGPDDYETWRDAAVAEKMQRIATERKLKELRDQVTMVLAKP